MTSKSVVVIPDMQIPAEDKKAIEAVTRFVDDFKPDELYCVGDEADSSQVSRWSKGTFDEWSGQLQKDFDRVHQVMGNFRTAIGDKPFHVQRSNHNDRLEVYTRKFAPALASLRDLTIEHQLGYDKLGVTYHRKPWKFAPGWLMMHGDEGNMTQTAGGTALSLARRTGYSVICGHTHKFGMQHENNGVNGQTNRTLFGIECGHLMDMREATYLKYGSANWQQGFVLLEISPLGKVHPQLVPIVNKSFIVDGEKYDW
jgi:hypothetical protein